MNSTSYRDSIILTVWFALLAVALAAKGADGTWNQAAHDSPGPAGPVMLGVRPWSGSTNWVGGIIPGTVGTTTSPDTLAMPMDLHATITLNNNYNVKNLSHNVVSHRHAIVTDGTSVLSLTGGGAVSGNSGSVHYYTPIRLEGGSGGSYTFNAGVLTIYGTVSGTAATGGNYDLLLGGGGAVDTSGAYVGSFADGAGGGTLSVIKTGTGKWTLNNASPYTGSSTIRQGTLVLNHISALGAAASDVNLGDSLSPVGGNIELEVLGNGTYTRHVVANTNNASGTTSIAVRQNRNPIWNGNIQLNRDIQFVNVNVGGLTVGGSISGVGGFTKIGENRLTLSAANTFGGDAVNSGTGQLRLNHLNALQNSTLDTGTAGSQVVEFNVAGTYNLGGLKGSNNLAIGANTISVGANNRTGTYSGVISATSGKLTKVGTGTLFLDGTNTYTNVTTVVAGGIGGGGALGGNLVLNAGTRFDAVIGRTLSVSNLTIGANGTITLSGPGVGTIIRYTGMQPAKFVNLVGFEGRALNYLTPGEIKVIRAGTVITLQ